MDLTRHTHTPSAVRPLAYFVVSRSKITETRRRVSMRSEEKKIKREQNTQVFFFTRNNSAAFYNLGPGSNRCFLFCSPFLSDLVLSSYFFAANITSLRKDNEFLLISHLCAGTVAHPGYVFPIMALGYNGAILTTFGSRFTSAHMNLYVAHYGSPTMTRSKCSTA